MAPLAGCGVATPLNLALLGPSPNLDGPAALALVFAPYYAAVEPATGALLFSSSFSNKVGAISGGFAYTIAGTGAWAAGPPQDGAATTAARVNPRGLAPAGNGTIYFADGAFIRRLQCSVAPPAAAASSPSASPSATPSQTATPAPNAFCRLSLVAPDVKNVGFGVAIVNSTLFYTSWLNAIPPNCIFSVPLGAGAGVAPTLVAGRCAPGTGVPLVDGPALNSSTMGPAATFNSPAGLVVHPLSGAIFVADSGNNAIRFVAGGVVTTLTGGGTSCAVASNLNNPRGIAWESGAYTSLIVVDLCNVVKRVSVITGAQTFVAGRAGVAGVADGVGTSAIFNVPQAVCVDFWLPWRTSPTLLLRCYARWRFLVASSPR